jgi:hypothetical protein
MAKLKVAWDDGRETTEYGDQADWAAKPHVASVTLIETGAHADDGSDRPSSAAEESGGDAQRESDRRPTDDP